jgi:hypothetical protein
MRDWQELVRQRLGGLALDSTEREAVHDELAAHLEEAYENLLAKGLSEQEAVRRTLTQIADWRDLQRQIFLARRGGHPMQKRTQQLWIPGLLTLALSTVFLMALQDQGFQPRIVSLSGPGAVLFYVPWLLSLPFFGALGAYLSSRAGGSRGTVLLASVFPPLALTAAFLSMFPIGWIVERIIGRQVGFSGAATAVLRDGIGWILFPGAALLAGGLLAQLLFSRRLASRRIAGS